MLTIEMLNEEIKKLEECENPTWGTCEKLATLYIIKDHWKVNQRNAVVVSAGETKEKL